MLAAAKTEAPVTGWKLPDEYVMLQETVRDFMTRAVRPEEEKSEFDSITLPPDVLERLRAKARSLGLWCVQSPAEYGGAGLDLLGQCVVAEEAAKCRMGLYFQACGAFGQDPPLVIFNGTRHQIEGSGVAAIAKGQKTFVAISEASGGSDPARAISTRAELKGDRYIVNGSKMWISGVNSADWGILYARTGAKGDRGGITAFIVDPKRAGVHWKKIGLMRSYQPFEVTFEKAAKFPSKIARRRGRGLPHRGELACARARALCGGEHRRRTRSIRACDRMGEAALDVRRLARRPAGDPVDDREEFEVELRASACLVYEAAWKGDRGEDIKIDASIAKVYATETAGRVVDRCMQIFGGLGMTHEMPLERWYRELRIRRVGEGPSEVQRMVIARDLLSRRS